MTAGFYGLLRMLFPECVDKDFKDIFHIAEVQLPMVSNVGGRCGFLLQTLGVKKSGMIW